MVYKVKLKVLEQVGYYYHMISLFYMYMQYRLDFIFDRLHIQSCCVSDALVLSSIVILVALFSIQRFGTGKVGFLFAPVLALWFFSLGSIGIYNLLKYDITVIRALNPYYIVLFFNKNSKQAWSALGGCVLCITGAEAMFADLGHFSVRSIQVSITFLIINDFIDDGYNNGIWIRWHSLAWCSHASS